MSNQNAKFDGLDFLWIELTEKCNLTCVHCYADSSPDKMLNGIMTLSKWKTVLLDSFIAGCRKVQFVGGEPTIHPDLASLITYSHDLGYDFIEIHTNAISISSRLLEVLKNSKVQVGISFYSINSTVHDKITKLEGSCKKTMANIRRLKQNNIPIRISIIKMKENEKDIDNTINFLKAEGIDEIGVDEIRNFGRGNRENKASGINDLCGNCWNGKLVVNPKGEIYACPMSRFKVLDNIENGLNSVLANPTLQEFRKSVYDYAVESQLIDSACMVECLPNCTPDRTGCNPQNCRPMTAY